MKAQLVGASSVLLRQVLKRWRAMKPDAEKKRPPFINLLKVRMCSYDPTSNIMSSCCSSGHDDFTTFCSLPSPSTHSQWTHLQACMSSFDVHQHGPLQLSPKYTNISQRCECLKCKQIVGHSSGHVIPNATLPNSSSPQWTISHAVVRSVRSGYLCRCRYLIMEAAKTA